MGPQLAQRPSRRGRAREGRAQPAGYCSLPHKTPLHSRKEGYKCVSMTWRAICGRPYAAVNLIYYRQNYALAIYLGALLSNALNPLLAGAQHSSTSHLD
jgi:hypothetical protein